MLRLLFSMLLISTAVYAAVDPNQAFYFDSSYGSWLSPTPVNGSDPTACNPPVNITVDMQTEYQDNTVSMTLSNGTTLTATAQPLTGPTSNLYWNIPTQNTNLTYSYDNALNQTYLQFEYLNAAGATCIFSYQKLNDFISGTWYNDWQNNNDTLPASIVVSIVNNTFLNMTLSNGSSYTLYEYAQDPVVAWNDYITAMYGQKYEYDYASDVLFSNGQYMFTRNGSILSAEPFVGNWSTPTFQDSSDEEQGCCLPSQISISIPESSPNTLNTTFYFTQDAVASHWCTDINIHTEGSTNYTTLNMSPYGPSPTSLTWTDGNNGYYLEFTNTSTTSQIRLILVGGIEGSCMFFMTPGNYVPDPNPTPTPTPSPTPSPSPSPSPSPKPIPDSSYWIGNSLFSLILSLVVLGLL